MIYNDQYYLLLGLCTTDIVVQSLVGIYDRSGNNNGVNDNNNEHHRDVGKKIDKDYTIITNPFRKYTIVNVLYCSGDVHGGNVTRSYRDKV